MENQSKKKSIKANVLFHFVYLVVLHILPFAVSPYLTRVLGKQALGSYTYALSIASFFVLFANLGIALYGQREIARVVGDPEKLRKTFWALFLVHLISALLALGAYAVFLFFVSSDELVLYLIMGITVLTPVFSTTWLFYGTERFKSVSVVSAIVALARTAALFVFVKGPEDLWVYTLIMCLGTFLSVFPLTVFAVKSLPPVKVGLQDVKPHLKPLFYYFLVVVASTVYSYFDKTLLGLMTGVENVALYEYANKVVEIPKVLIGALPTVLFPKICALVEKKQNQEAARLTDVSIELSSLLGIGAAFGLLAIGKPFAEFYYGGSFSESGSLMMAMSPIIVIASLADVIRTHFLIPHGKDVQFLISIIVDAMVNLSISAATIPSLGAYGAILGTICGQLTGLIIELVFCRSFFSPKRLLLPFLAYSVVGGVMAVIVFFVSKALPSSLFSLIIQFFIGLFVFLVGSSIYLFFLNKHKTFYRAKLLSFFQRKAVSCDSRKND